MGWLFNSDGRRAGAFLALLGAAMVFTVYAAVVLFIVRGSTGLAFWLGIAAHMQIAIITTGFIALFVKRTLSVSKDGITVNDASTEIATHTTTTVTPNNGQDTSVVVN